METVRIGVEGMSCGGCVKNVTGALSALPGVSRVEVSLENKCAEVAFDPAQIQRPALVAAVEDAGFDAT